MMVITQIIKMILMIIKGQENDNNNYKDNIMTTRIVTNP